MLERWDLFGAIADGFEAIGEVLVTIGEAVVEEPFLRRPFGEPKIDGATEYQTRKCQTLYRENCVCALCWDKSFWEVP